MPVAFDFMIYHLLLALCSIFGSDGRYLFPPQPWTLAFFLDKFLQYLLLSLPHFTPWPCKPFPKSAIRVAFILGLTGSSFLASNHQTKDCREDTRNLCRAQYQCKFSHSQQDQYCFPFFPVTFPSAPITQATKRADLKQSIWKEHNYACSKAFFFWKTILKKVPGCIFWTCSCFST